MLAWHRARGVGDTISQFSPEAKGFNQESPEFQGKMKPPPLILHGHH